MDPGLCASCAHARPVPTPRSTFWRCARSEAEPARFPRYPRLPVLACQGHTKGSAEGSAEGPAQGSAQG